jgi:hypothetical protein
MTRLLMQALSDMGYQEAAESVSKDSGIELEHPTVAAFRAAVLDGGWHRAEALLDGAVLAGEDQRKGNGLILSSAAEPERKRMKFLLKQQKYLELLEQQESARALLVLRNELAPLCEEKPLHTLASLLMCQSPDDLRVKAKWDGAGGQSRQELLSELSSKSKHLSQDQRGPLVDRAMIANLAFHRKCIAISYASRASSSCLAPAGEGTSD